MKDRPMRQQPNWDNHARFMDTLAADKFILLGGPLSDSEDVLLIVEADDEQQIYETFNRDPWASAGILVVTSVKRWNVLLDSRKQ